MPAAIVIRNKEQLQGIKIESSLCKLFTLGLHRDIGGDFAENIVPRDINVIDYVIRRLFSYENEDCLTRSHNRVFFIGVAGLSTNAIEKVSQLVFLNAPMVLLASSEEWINSFKQYIPDTSVVYL